MRTLIGILLLILAAAIPLGFGIKLWLQRRRERFQRAKGLRIDLTKRDEEHGAPASQREAIKR